MLTWHK